MELGTIASAAQFVDLGCRSLFGVYRFLKDLRDVPGDLLLVLEDLSHFLEFMHELQLAISNRDPRLRNLETRQLERIAHILDSTGEACQQLEELLAPCRTSPGTSSTQKVWRAFVSVKRESEIIKKCDRLERLKHDLNRELQNSGLALLASVRSDLVSVSATLQQTNISLSMIEHRLDSVNSSIHNIRSDLVVDRGTTKHHSDQSQTPTMNQMISELHRCLILGEHPTSTLSSGFKNATTNARAHILATSAGQLVKYPQDLKTAPERIKNISDDSSSPQSPWPGISTSCHCPRAGSQIKQRSVMVGPFRHLSSLKQKHRADCPLFSATDFEKTQSLAFPTIPFMSRTVELFFSLYSNQQVTSFSVSYYPTVRRAGSPAFALFHDALGEAKREVCEFRAGFQSGGTQIRAGSWREAHPTFNELQISLQKIPAKLEAMFKSGQAMPRERDEFGNTLLFELLYICQMVSGTTASSPPFRRLVAEIATRLINFGVDVDVTLPYLPRFSAGYWASNISKLTSTAGDLAFSALAMQGGRSGSSSSELSLYRGLISKLGVIIDFQKLSRLTDCPFELLRYKSTCLDLLRGPHAADLSTDLTPLHFAILTRSRSKLQRLLAHGTCPSTAILTPMECALGWPEGLDLLARAGYFPIPAFKLAIFHQDLDSVAQILSAEFPIFSDVDAFEDTDELFWSMWNILEASLCLHCHWTLYVGNCLQRHQRLQCCLEDPGVSETVQRNVRNRLVVAVKHRRDALAKLAVENLPLQQVRELGICCGSPLDSKAQTTYITLRNLGISVPDFLQPGPRPLLLSFNISCEHRGFSLMRALFDSGVCELDPSLDGVTPLVSLFRESLADGQKETMIRWFLEHGACASFASASMFPNLLFYLATVYDSSAVYKTNDLLPGAIEVVGHVPGNPLLKQEYRKTGPAVAIPEERKTTPTMIGMVSQVCDPLERDPCGCACSFGGCLPLHKFRNGIPFRGFGFTPSWLPWGTSYVPKRWASVSETILSWTQDCQLDGPQTREYLRDACRLEVFTRLGMAHTCCIFDHGANARHASFPRRRERDEETRRELEDEDVELKQHLEAIIEVYDMALKMHQGSIEGFWEWWWVTLHGLLPEIPAEQRRRMYGDNGTSGNSIFKARLYSQLAERWELWVVYDEVDVDAAGGLDYTGGNQKMEFLEEIKHYFADILSQSSLSDGSMKLGKQNEESEFEGGANAV